MRASELARPYPTVQLDTDGLTALRLLAAERLPGLIIVDPQGRPSAILPGSQVLNFIVPDYVRQEPGLARAYDETAADEACARLSQATVRDIVPRHTDPDELPVVDADATLIEVAAVMSRAHSPVVAVVSGGDMVGAITLGALLDHLSS